MPELLIEQEREAIRIGYPPAYDPSMALLISSSEKGVSCRPFSSMVTFSLSPRNPHPA
jgi:hypothetical protein